MTAGMYDDGLPKTAANFAALTPLNFIERAASVYPARPAIVHGEVRRNWAETYARTRRLASALAARASAWATRSRRCCRTRPKWSKRTSACR